MMHVFIPSIGALRQRIRRLRKVQISRKRHPPHQRRGRLRHRPKIRRNATRTAPRGDHLRLQPTAPPHATEGELSAGDSVHRRRVHVRVRAVFGDVGTGYTEHCRFDAAFEAGAGEQLCK